MTSSTDTIVAISTATGEGGIAIVRISGPASLAIADQVFHGAACKPSDMDANSFAHGYVQAGSGEDADEVILLVYHPPRSYTREWVVELQGHGGRMAAKRILQAVLAAGARAAEPGEFTRRAFLNGRIDLVQAEAVCDLINARTNRAAAAAIEQLEGSLSISLSNSYESLMVAAADLEALLDFDDGELPEAATREPENHLQAAIADLNSLLETWEEGHLLREGATAVIAGQPNVGKSTLLNGLLGCARAIVSEQPGTTRDTIEEQINLGGVPVRLVDTAGLRAADCEIEQEGVSRAETYLARADLVVLVVDSARPVQEADRVIAGRANECLVVLNKTDLGQVATATDFAERPCVAVSLLKAGGAEPVREAMAEALSIHADQPAHAVISERHRLIIQEAIELLRQAMGLLEGGQEDVLVLAAADLRKALEALGTVTGRIYSEELLDSVFSRFCIGK